MHTCDRMPSCPTLRTNRSGSGTSRSGLASRPSAENTIGSGSCVHIPKSTYWLLATTGGQERFLSFCTRLYFREVAVGRPDGRKVQVPVHESSLALMLQNRLLQMHEVRPGHVHGVVLVSIHAVRLAHIDSARLMHTLLVRLLCIAMALLVLSMHLLIPSTCPVLSSGNCMPVPPPSSDHCCRVFSCCFRQYSLPLSSQT